MSVGDVFVKRLQVLDPERKQPDGSTARLRVGVGTFGVSVCVRTRRQPWWLIVRSWCVACMFVIDGLTPGTRALTGQFPGRIGEPAVRNPPVDNVEADIADVGVVAASWDAIERWRCSVLSGRGRPGAPSHVE